MGMGVTQELYKYTYMFEKLEKFVRRDKHLCRACGKTKARFMIRGRIKARKDHDLCFRCFRKYRAEFAQVAQLTLREA